MQHRNYTFRESSMGWFSKQIFFKIIVPWLSPETAQKVSPRKVLQDIKTCIVYSGQAGKLCSFHNVFQSNRSLLIIYLWIIINNTISLYVYCLQQAGRHCSLQFNQLFLIIYLRIIINTISIYVHVQAMWLEANERACISASSLHAVSEEEEETQSTFSG